MEDAKAAGLLDKEDYPLFLSWTPWSERMLIFCKLQRQRESDRIKGLFADEDHDDSEIVKVIRKTGLVTWNQAREIAEAINQAINETKES